MHVISEVWAEPDYKVRLLYSDGIVEIVDFKPVIARGGVFAALLEPDLFSRVSVGERGRYITWPGELDFCADALWLEAHGDGSNDVA